MSSTEKKAATVGTNISRKKSVTTGLNPWFCDNVGLAQHLARRRSVSISTDRINSAICRSNVSSKAKKQVKSAQTNGSTDSDDRGPAKPLGFTVHFSLSRAIRSVRRQEREAYRPTISPIKVAQGSKVKQIIPKKHKPVLKRFVFDFETRKWKPEYVIAGKAAITTELLVPETPPASGKTRTHRNVRRDSETTEAGLSSTNPSLTSSVQSINSIDFSQSEYPMYSLESAVHTGYGTSRSDISTGESSDAHDTSRTIHSDVVIHDMEPILKASTRRRESQASEGTDTTHEDLDLLQDIENFQLTDLQGDANKEDVVSSRGSQADITSHTESHEHNNDIIEELIRKMQSLEKQSNDFCANDDAVCEQNEDTTSSDVRPRLDSLREIDNQHLKDKRFRILDAETNEDIGKMRYLSSGGSKITVKKRQRSSRSQLNRYSAPEPRVLCSDSDDQDVEADEYPGCRYLYRIVHCRAVTNPRAILHKPDCNIKASGIIEVYTGHANTGGLPSADLTCPYCIHEPGRRITRWLNTLYKDSPGRLYTNRDAHYYTRTVRKQPPKRHASGARQLLTIPEG